MCISNFFCTFCELQEDMHLGPLLRYVANVTAGKKLTMYRLTSEARSIGSVMKLYQALMEKLYVL